MDLCYNPQNNKVYCANSGSNTVTVIDCASNSVLATVAVGSYPVALCYNPQNNKVYCANWEGDSVAVVDGATDSVVCTIAVGLWPIALVRNPAQNRVYVANQGNSTISVLRDSGGGIEEIPRSQASSAKPATTVVRGLPQGAVAFDAMGRRVVSAKSGVYFIAVSGERSAVAKVLILR